jgi:hypothetical protein
MNLAQRQSAYLRNLSDVEFKNYIRFLNPRATPYFFNLDYDIRERYALTYSEGSKELMNALLTTWNNKILTNSCCSAINTTHKKDIYVGPQIQFVARSSNIAKLRTVKLNALRHGFIPYSQHISPLNTNAVIDTGIGLPYLSKRTESPISANESNKFFKLVNEVLAKSHF